MEDALSSVELWWRLGELQAALIETMKSEDARVVIQEPFYPVRTTRIIADKAGGRVLVVRFGPDLEAGETYLSHIDDVTHTVLKGLGEGEAP